MKRRLLWWLIPAFVWLFFTGGAVVSIVQRIMEPGYVFLFWFVFQLLTWGIAWALVAVIRAIRRRAAQR